MNLIEFYDVVGGSFDDVMGRLMKEERITKYLAKFIDSPEFDNMLAAYEAQDWETMFRESHSLKGMAANLGLENFREAVSNVCETVRHGAPETDITELLDKAKTEYEVAIDAIKEAVQ